MDKLTELEQQQLDLLERITPQMSEAEKERIFADVHEIQRKINKLLGIGGKS